MGLGVDGAVVCDCVLGGALSADLDDLVAGGGVDLVDEGVGDIGEDDVVAGVVEEAGNEATALERLVGPKEKGQNGSSKTYQCCRRQSEQRSCP